MSEIGETASSAAEFLRALSPTSHAMVLLSFGGGLSLYLFSERPWALWPFPVQMLVWGWVALALLAVPFTFVLSSISALVHHLRAPTVPQMAKPASSHGAASLATESEILNKER